MNVPHIVIFHASVFVQIKSELQHVLTGRFFSYYILNGLLTQSCSARMFSYNYL